VAISVVVAAMSFYAARNRTVTAKRLADVAAELIAVKEAQGASTRFEFAVARGYAAGNPMAGVEALTIRAKTGMRRVVPVYDALAAWLASYADRTGNVWQGAHRDFCAGQENTPRAAGVTWKKNGLRHSYASYRFAQTGDAGRVAGELGGLREAGR